MRILAAGFLLFASLSLAASKAEAAEAPLAGAAITVAVDPNADRRAINPHIYGAANFDDPGISQISFPVRRWGGNGTTRYNWKLDISNHASDYLFLNIPNFVANPAALPNNSTADLWLDSTRAHFGEPVLTIPTIGWTPTGTLATRDTQIWGMSIAKYGAQQYNECQVNPYMGCRTDAGNGCAFGSPPGQCNLFTPNIPFNPTDTSDAVTPAYGVEWMDHIAMRIGAGSLKYIILDNEPGLWNSTHRDAHQAALTYDELWQKSRDSAIAFKTKDPNVKILGPASYGWCEYFFSPADGVLYPGCQVGPDRNAHGGLELIAWFLQQVEAYRVANGVRLIDYLDLHYYPQASFVYGGDESTAALRLRTLKSLYDPTYVDESYIGEPVNLIPRMRAWVNANAPGTKIAINEYNWGDIGTSAALAQAEALAIFGREGLDMANRWVAPKANTLIEDAFLLYLNYNGAGAKVSGESVRAVSSNIDQVGSYAVRGTNSIYVLLFNKDTASHSTTVSMVGGITQSAALYMFDGATRLSSAVSAVPSGGTLTLNLGARSATLAVIPYAVPVVATITPGCANVSGGRSVTITGTNFQAGAAVTLTGTQAVINSVAAGSITATTGSRAAGSAVTGNVVVTNPDSQTGTLVGGFTYGVRGDANNSGGLTPSDASWLNDYFAGAGPVPAFPCIGGDANATGSFTPTDASYLNDYFAGAGPAPGP